MRSREPLAGAVLPFQGPHSRLQLTPRELRNRKGGAPTVSRIVRLATTSLATLEDTAPPYNLRYPNPADTLKLGLSMLDAAGAQEADLVLLPEGFMAAGLPASEIPIVAEPLEGPSFQAIAERARRHSMY